MTAGDLALLKAKHRERDLLEYRSRRTRQYMAANVTSVLAEGILKLCEEQPEDPIESLVITVQELE